MISSTFFWPSKYGKITSLHINFCDEIYQNGNNFHSEQKDNVLLLGYLTPVERKSFSNKGNYNWKL